MFSGDSQCRTTRHEDCQCRRASQQLRQERSRIRDLLEVIEYQQQPLVFEMLDQELGKGSSPALTQTQTVCDHRKHDTRIANCRERHEYEPVLKSV